MPIVKFKKVSVCSSEDTNYPASNLINGSDKKWKCEETGLDSVYVVLEFESPTKISGIDFGNEHSAHIEVDVGRNGWPIEKYKPILITSSLMTIIDSRESKNPNQVRCFDKSKLQPDVLNEKWDLIKVTCKQSYNKHVKFGLSFIKVHTPDAIPTSATASPLAAVAKSPKEKKNCDEILELPKNNVFAQFKMHGENSSDSDKETEQSTSLFSKWKQSSQDSPQKASANGQSRSSAAAIRDASASMSQLEECTKINRKIDTPSSSSSSSSSKARKSNESAEAKKQRTDRYRPAILYDDDDENTSNPKLEKAIEQDKARIEEERKQWLDKKKPKTPTPNLNSSSREEKSKQKMESSSDKFNTFLSDDIDDKSVDRPETTNANVLQGAVRDIGGNDDDDDDEVVEVKAKSPAKTSSNDTTSSPATGSRSPAPSTPSNYVWKTKRPTPSSVENASKRRRISSSSDEDEDVPNVRVRVDQILQGVVFVISGIQNPERAEMREKGVKMGAYYKPDWDNSCTHLVCAFKNTPKYNQVKGQGIIVNRDWIEDCYSAKKKLPWQDYKL